MVLVRFPHPSGSRGKRRPAVVVQADSYSAVVGTLLVAEITGNLSMGLLRVLAHDGRDEEAATEVRWRSCLVVGLG